MKAIWRSRGESSSDETEYDWGVRYQIQSGTVPRPTEIKGLQEYF